MTRKIYDIKFEKESVYHRVSGTGIFRVSANVRGDICQSNLTTIRACIIKYKVEWRHTTIKQIRRGEDRYLELRYT
jgi:hypothetical protein